MISLPNCLTKPNFSRDDIQRFEKSCNYRLTVMASGDDWRFVEWRWSSSKAEDVVDDLAGSWFWADVETEGEQTVKVRSWRLQKAQVS